MEDPKVEEAPPEPSSSIRIIIINTKYLHIKEHHQRKKNKRRKAHVANTQQRLHFSTNNIKASLPQVSISLQLSR